MLRPPMPRSTYRRLQKEVDESGEDFVMREGKLFVNSRVTIPTNEEIAQEYFHKELRAMEEEEKLMEGLEKSSPKHQAEFPTRRRRQRGEIPSLPIANKLGSVDPNETFILEAISDTPEDKAKAKKARDIKALVSRAAYWGGVVILAFLSAIFVRYFLLSQYVIPSSSMENTYVVGERIVTLGMPIQYFMSYLAKYWYVTMIVVLGLFAGTVAYWMKIQNWSIPRGKNLLKLAGASLVAGFLMSFSVHPIYSQIDRNTVERGDVVVFSDKYKWLAGESENNGSLVKRVIGVPGDYVRMDISGVYVNDKFLKEPYVKTGCPASTSNVDIKIPKDKFFVLGDNRCSSADSSKHVNDGNDGLVDREQITGKVRFSLPNMFGVVRK